MTAHTKRPARAATGPVDKDRNNKRTKMDRELPDTDARNVNDADLRGRGREMTKQQRQPPHGDK